MWDQRYSEPGFAYGTDPNDLLVERAGLLQPGARVLCIAEGEGRNAIFLAGLGHDVTAVDLSQVGLEKARARAESLGLPLRTVHADLMDYEPDPGAWDAVVSIWAHLPPPVRAVVHARVVRALRPGGVLILEAYAPEQLQHRTGGPQTLDLLYSLDLLRSDFGALEVQHLWTGVREIHEGRYHDGPSAVVQLVAVKPG